MRYRRRNTASTGRAWSEISKIRKEMWRREERKEVVSCSVEESSPKENLAALPSIVTRQPEDHEQKKSNRLNFTRLTALILMFVSVRGPLFRVEDLTELGWSRVSSWKVLNNLVKAGVLEKFDRKSYGLTEDGRRWFRSAFGGGINDAAFAYSTMGVDSWSGTRLSHFKTRLTGLWEERPERVRDDPARTGLMRAGTEEEGYSTVQTLLIEKIGEVHSLAMMLEKKRETRSL